MIILPSLEIVPAKYNTSTNTLLSQIPIDGTGDFTVSRTTSPVTGQSTRVNALGQIELVADNVPRLDYFATGGTVGCPALLVEPSAANGILNSTDTTTSWTLGANLTRGAIDVIGVSGTNLTVAVSGSGINLAAGRIARSGNNVALASGSTYTISFFVKKTVTHTIGGYYALITGAASGNLGAGFDVSGSFSSGSIFDTAGTTNRIRRIEQWGTDVFRCSETFTMTASGTLTSFFLAPVASVTSSNNSAVGTQLGFAAPQIELGSVPTSFIPTTTASVTRNADVISVSGAVSGSIGQTEGTVFIDFVYRRNAPDGLIPILLTNTSADQVYVHIRTSGAIGVDYYFNSSFSAQLFTATGFVVNNTRYKVAFVYKENDFALYINGQQIATDNSGIVRSLTSLHFVYPYLTGYGPAGQTVNQAALYATRLSNAELALITQL